jgi:transcriptional regulator with XRE-family HTH domain
MNGLLEQIKKRRKQLGLKQADMMLRAGISRQQYQHMESKGNPRLDTLELVAKGLNSELLLVPKDKVLAVKAALEGTNNAAAPKVSRKSLTDDPWQDMLEDDA